VATLIRKRCRDSASESLSRCAGGFGHLCSRLRTSTLATSPQLDSIGGRYFEDCNEAIPVYDGNGWASGVAPYALDTDNAECLWEASLRLLS
jgi:hypothetical protein